MCIVCNKNSSFRIVGEYKRCTQCNSLVASFLPNNKNVQKVLENHSSYIVEKENKIIHLELFQKRLSVLKNYSSTVHIILDFGCGDGGFVKYIQTKGYKASGYDKSKNVQKYLRANHIPSYKNLRDIPNNFFDVVTCFDVIEHTVDSHEFIQLIKAKVKTNGILLMTTPNAKSFSSRVLGQKWWVFGSSAHFVLFSPNSLKLFLSDEGFEVLSVYTDILTPWFTPSGNFLFRVLNKLVYLATLPFHSFLFSHSLGDNIQVVAKKKPTG